MTTITVIGSLNYDLVTFTDKVPSAGETFQANSFENHLGGKGLNEALAVARLSPKEITTRMIGNIGNDNFGKELKQALVDSDVDVNFVKTLQDQSLGVAVILVEEGGENRILITAGANGELKPSKEEYKEYFSTQHDGFVILQNEYPDTVKTMDWLVTNRSEINIAYNPSPFKKDLITHEILRNIDLLIVNEGEALDVERYLGGSVDNGKVDAATKSDNISRFSELSTKLQGMINPFKVNTVIITMGSHGCVFVSKGLEPQFHPSRKVKEVVDTTGAGDTFFGGVVLQLALGKDIGEAVKFATVASSLVIQKKGAAESIPKYEDVSC